MLRTSLYVLIALAFVGGLFLLVRNQLELRISRVSNLSTNLLFIMTEEQGAPSFDPVHSDTLLNAYFVEQLVGTLVKHGFDGVPEGCLAESWKASDDLKEISFRIRQGVKCEDGTQVTASAYYRNLKRIFRLYNSLNKSLPVFEHLEGFDQFRKGLSDEIKGITVDGESLRFAFDTVPDGILAFLSMPYYGFYCESNFNADGSWKDPHKIVSSGQWKLTSFNNDRVVITRRKEWFKASVRAPESVTIEMMPFEKARKLPPVRTVIQKRIESYLDIPSGYSKFLSTPTDLKAVVLSPIRHGPFKSLLLRESFRNEVQRLASEKSMFSENARNTVAFYPGKVSPQPSRSTIDAGEIEKWRGHVLKVVVSNALTRNQLEYTQGILSAAAHALGFGVSFAQEDRSKPGWKERLDSLEDMDIRVVRVSVGGNYEPWVVRMMFCSRLGVSFPDPSGRICKLATNLTDRSPDIAAKFEKIVLEDAAVIPLFHTSFSWLVSTDVGIDRLSPTSDLIRFELIEL